LPSDTSTLSLHDALPISTPTSDGGTTKAKVLVAALIASLAFVLQLALASPGSASTGVLCPQTGMETVSTNRPDNPPGAIVHMSRSEEHTSELQSRSDLVC